MAHPTAARFMARKEIEAQNDGFDAGYNAAINDSIGLLRKWFWGTNKDARACENDLRKLAKK